MKKTAKMRRLIQEHNEQTEDLIHNYTRELQQFFNNIGKKIEKNPLQYQQIISKEWEEYLELLSYYALQANRTGINFIDNYTLLLPPKQSLLCSKKIPFKFDLNMNINTKVSILIQSSSHFVERRYGKIMKKTLAQAYEEGGGYEGTAKKLIHNMTRQFTTFQAQRIARTEIASHKNIAHYERAKDLGIETHEWVCMLDDRTRDSHAEMEGETVPIGKPFSNGLLHPGDREGTDPSEYINCRCIALPVI